MMRKGAQTPRKRFLCRAGVSFLEGKEDIFEDWREKFFNTWKVRMPPTCLHTPARGKSSPPLLPPSQGLNQIATRLLLRTWRDAREQTG